MHILLLEPNTLLAQTYTKGLAHAGHTVLHATNAQAAVDAADQHTPDAVIVELQLAAHSGIEFLHEFRSYAEWQHIPVIINTLVTPPKLAPMAETLRRDLGVRAVLYKPQATIQDILRAVLAATATA